MHRLLFCKLGDDPVQYVNHDDYSIYQQVCDLDILDLRIVLLEEFQLWFQDKKYSSLDFGFF